jgi:hypothetical protein
MNFQRHHHLGYTGSDNYYTDGNSGISNESSV